MPAKLVMVVRSSMARREVVISLPVEIDTCNADHVTEELTMAVGRHPVVIIDMSATTSCGGGHALPCGPTSVPPIAAARCVW